MTSLKRSIKFFEVLRRHRRQLFLFKSENFLIHKLSEFFRNAVMLMTLEQNADHTLTRVTALYYSGGVPQRRLG